MTKNRPLDFRPRSLSAILLFVVVLLQLSPSADGLKCYMCTDWSEAPGEEHSVNGCLNSKPTECPRGSKSCSKTWSKLGDDEVVSRWCSDKTSVDEECVEEEAVKGPHKGKKGKVCSYLCPTDACNSSPSRRSSVNPLLVWAAAVGATLAVLYQQQV